MTPENVKSLFFLDSSPAQFSHSLLFHCAKYFAAIGNRVLYVSQAPFSSLPLEIGSSTQNSNPETFNHIHFTYLPRWQDLLQQLYSIHVKANPPSVIIIQHFEQYCGNDIVSDPHDRTSLICASAIHAANVCATRNKKTSTLITSYYSKDSMLPKTIVKNFFQNIWLVQESDDELEVMKQFKITCLSLKAHGPTSYVFAVSGEEGRLVILDAYQKLQMILKDS